MQDGSTLKNSVFQSEITCVRNAMPKPSGTESGKCYRILQSVVLPNAVPIL